MPKKNVVRVSIVGEEYATRSDSTPEHTQLARSLGLKPSGPP